MANAMSTAEWSRIVHGVEQAFLVFSKLYVSPSVSITSAELS